MYIHVLIIVFCFIQCICVWKHYIIIQLTTHWGFSLGRSRKDPYHPHGGNRKLTPPTPFGCPNTFTIIRNNFSSPPPPDGRNFLRGGSMDLFWNDPMRI